MLLNLQSIIGIGKAKNIPNRLRNYVTESNLPIRTERMLSLTHSLETTTTNNESEALLLEANLIKKHKPRFNILLRDDKSFPYIYIGNKDKWPQLTKLRGKKSKTGYYFGPFASVGSANWTIKILQKVFYHFFYPHHKYYLSPQQILDQILYYLDYYTLWLLRPHLV